MDETKLRAINAMIAIEVEKAHVEFSHFVVSSRAVNPALALHQGLGHLRSQLMPAVEEKLITYCIDLGVLDVDAIAGQLVIAFDTRFRAMALSTAASIRGPAAGAVRQTIASFEGQVQVWCNQLRSRVLVAVERARSMKIAKQDGGIVVGTVNASTVQIGHENSHTTNINMTLQHLAQQVAASQDPEAKGLLRNLLNNATIGALLGAGATEVLLKLFGGS